MLETAIDPMTRALASAADEVIPELVAERRALHRGARRTSAQPPLPAISLALDVAGARPLGRLDAMARTRHAHDVMSTARVARMLEMAAELADDERLELAEELWERVPDKLSPAWEAELRRRMSDMDAAEARGDSPGRVLTIDAAIEHARRPGNADG